MKDTKPSSQKSASQEPGSVPASGSQPRQTQSQQDHAAVPGGKQPGGQASTSEQAGQPQQETMKDKRDSYSGGRSGND